MENKTETVKRDIIVVDKSVIRELLAMQCTCDKYNYNNPDGIFREITFCSQCGAKIKWRCAHG